MRSFASIVDLGSEPCASMEEKEEEEEEEVLGDQILIHSTGEKETSRLCGVAVSSVSRGRYRHVRKRARWRASDKSLFGPGYRQIDPDSAL